MKKLLVMAAMVLSSVGAFAQYSAGDFTIQPKVGLNCASVTTDGADYKAGFVGGAELEYHISPLVGLSGGLLYSFQGFKVSEDHVSATWSLSYLNIPILANFYVAKGLALKAGVQPGFMVGKDDANSDVVKTFDFSVPVGISYEYMNFCLDARYNIGCTKVFDGADGNNSVFQLTLGYKFKL